MPPLQTRCVKAEPGLATDAEPRRLIMRRYRVWCRANLRKKSRPTGQDAAQFFTDLAVAGKWPPGLTWPEVYRVLKEKRAFDHT